jgi:hypothetical protein
MPFLDGVLALQHELAHVNEGRLVRSKTNVAARSQGKPISPDKIALFSASYANQRSVGKAAWGRQVHTLLRKARRAFLTAIAMKNNTVAKSTIVAPLDART